MSDRHFTKVCRRDEIPRGGMRNFTVSNREIIIADTDSGLVARSGLCKHNGFKLELCDRLGDVIRCPLHGWEYRISTGKGIKPDWTELDRYPLEVRGEAVWVAVQATDRSDEPPDVSNYQW